MKRITIVSVILLCIAAITLFSWPGIQRIWRLQTRGIGKELYMNVHEGEVWDGDVVRTRLSLLNEPALDRLVRYMAQNRLRLKPGLCHMNQTSSFAEVKRILAFEPLTDV